jgi:hypothetical protein
MAAPLSDAVVVDAFRRVDRLLSPAVIRLARPPALPQEERDRWWGERLPRVAAVVSAAPRFLGRLADLLPLQNTVGTAVQSIVVLGVAQEHGVTDPAERVSLLARVLVARDLPPDRVEPLLVHAKGTYREDALGAPGRRGPVRTIWRASRILARIDDALDARPKGRLHHRALANLPVVGVLGGSAAEQEARRGGAHRAVAVLEGRVSREPRIRPPGWQTPHASPSTGSG